MTHVAIVDYGTGNVSSIARMLAMLQVSVVHTHDAALLEMATHIILPGVGHCRRAMDSLNATGTIEVLQELVIARGMPVLGICLGMQIMTLRSQEGDTQCLGWFQCETVELTPHNKKQFKVPNIGWHTIASVGNEALFNHIDLSRQPFYFCHRYGVEMSERNDLIATFGYDRTFAAALRRDNVVGVQFHPEKSQDAGMQLMRNFLQMGTRNV